MKNACAVVLFLAASLTGAASRGAAPPGLAIVKTIKLNGKNLTVANFTQGGATAGLIGIRPAGITFAAAKTRWGELEGLWDQAAKTDSKKWKFIGALTEINTDSPSHLMVYAGPQVQIVIVDPSLGAQAFLVPEKEKDAFGKALRAVEAAIVDPVDPKPE